MWMTTLMGLPALAQSNHPHETCADIMRFTQQDLQDQALERNKLTMRGVAHLKVF